MRVNKSSVSQVRMSTRHSLAELALFKEGEACEPGWGYHRK